MSKYIIKRIIIAVVTILAIISIVFLIGLLNRSEPDDMILAKPVIYLYPEKEMNVSVKLGSTVLTSSWPESADAQWNVTAAPDGTVKDEAGQEYSYIFWEGVSEGFEPDFSRGFCIRGEDTAEFLRQTLSEMGLKPREYNEFIVYWAPQMQKNAYNIISFQGENYDAAAPLDISPAPDSMLRVFMAWKASDEYVSMEPQQIAAFERKDFTVVEWGGCEVGNMPA